MQPTSCTFVRALDSSGRVGKVPTRTVATQPRVSCNRPCAASGRIPSAPEQPPSGRVAHFVLRLFHRRQFFRLRAKMQTSRNTVQFMRHMDEENALSDGLCASKHGMWFVSIFNAIASCAHRRGDPIPKSWILYGSSHICYHVRFHNTSHHQLIGGKWLYHIACCFAVVVVSSFTHKLVPSPGCRRHSFLIWCIQPADGDIRR